MDYFPYDLKTANSARKLLCFELHFIMLKITIDIFDVC